MPYLRRSRGDEQERLAITGGITSVILAPMKTAISIPDPLFERADSYARHAGISRSQLYAVAIESYLRDHERQSVTAALDRIYSEEPSSLDPVLAQLQSAILPKDEW
jgi:predicted DNA-binding protein